MVSHVDRHFPVPHHKTICLKSRVLVPHSPSLSPAYYRTARTPLYYTCANLFAVVHNFARPPLFAF